MIRIALVLIALLSVGLAGCRRAEDHDDHAHERIALEAAARLPTAFNRDACGFMFEQAEMRDSPNELQGFWLSQCANMLKTTGKWLNLRETAASPLPKSSPESIMVQGDSVFEKGEYHLDSYWQIQREQARLYFLLLSNRDRQLYLPGPPHVRPQLMDSPAGPNTHS